MSKTATATTLESLIEQRDQIQKEINKLVKEQRKEAARPNDGAEQEQSARYNSRNERENPPRSENETSKRASLYEAGYSVIYHLTPESALHQGAQHIVSR